MLTYSLQICLSLTVVHVTVVGLVSYDYNFLRKILAELVKRKSLAVLTKSVHKS